ncbi:MAG: hypothetical protein AAF787_16630 [Chloroflexota bacterium]
MLNCKASLQNSGVLYMMPVDSAEAVRHVMQALRRVGDGLVAHRYV